jgi:hypothetical protein
MKQPESKLKNVASTPRIMIVDTQNLRSTNASIRRLIIDGWDGILDQIGCFLLKLNQVCILVY